ncbi:hypothetical protein GCM10010430_24360 [Kitasatospora cystarginea]|uniref:Uncharacterized protein n=1 Tax=Kitasatospora cystarginea TaxID=58350 RepID=A0ABN3DUW6_9ACTN
MPAVPQGARPGKAGDRWDEGVAAARTEVCGSASENSGAMAEAAAVLTVSEGGIVAGQSHDHDSDPQLVGERTTRPAYRYSPRFDL